METRKRRSGEESEGERDRETKTDRQAETDRYTQRQKDRENQRERETHTHIDTYVHTYTYIHTCTHTECWMLGIFKTWPVEAADGMHEIPGSHHESGEESSRNRLLPQST